MVINDGDNNWISSWKRNKGINRSCVQTKHFGKDIGAGLRSVVGGEAKGYTELMEESRRTAMQRMINDAEKIGADAIVGMRYATAQTMHGAAELIAFGTAVKTL